VIVPALKLSNPGSKTGLMTAREPIFQVERVELDMLARQNNFVQQIALRRNSKNNATLTAEDAMRNRSRSYGEVDDSETLNSELKRFDRSLGKGVRPFKFPKAELEIYKHNRIFKQGGDLQSARVKWNQTETFNYKTMQA
jgi:hypothetical protein